MIKINPHPEYRVNLYDPKGDLMGAVNELELRDVQIQIFKQEAIGYYITHFDSNEKIMIESNGILSNFPKQFEQNYYLTIKLLK